jgi:hypothetical protein
MRMASAFAQVITLRKRSLRSKNLLEENLARIPHRTWSTDIQTNMYTILNPILVKVYQTLLGVATWLVNILCRLDITFAVNTLGSHTQH